ncbi:MAG TPA: hypothetical protein PLV06_04535 [Bacteroidales bacterium]|nr:hypothetical protein [Bacteroidales bacterium]HPF03509.1 hypothetical protein [Bacteroidales bacterium]HPJ58455.1 hypothetical protein [Bacteroidales bacterium]HPR11630.1 hypothetical protein [Bacteroidales bacterium]HRW84991.1 hypothetical protein [Bacteroidales bacterium]
MKSSELKKLIIKSLEEDAGNESIAGRLEMEGVTFDFGRDFTRKVVDKVFSVSSEIVAERELFRSMRFVFNRVALTGVAAILILLFSIFLAEGSFSLNSFLGIGDSIDESIVCLLTDI